MLEAFQSLREELAKQKKVNLLLEAHICIFLYTYFIDHSVKF